MLKNTIAVCVIFISILSVASPAYCAESPVTKFGRGLCNLVTFYLEIGEQSRRVKEEHGSVAGMTYGIGKGLVMAALRAIVGVYEVATFPFPYPKDYQPILTDPVSFFPEPKKEQSFS